MAWTAAPESHQCVVSQRRTCLLWHAAPGRGLDCGQLTAILAADLSFAQYIELGIHRLSQAAVALLIYRQVRGFGGVAG